MRPSLRHFARVIRLTLRRCRSTHRARNRWALGHPKKGRGTFTRCGRRNRQTASPTNPLCGANKTARGGLSVRRMRRSPATWARDTHGIRAARNHGLTRPWTRDRTDDRQVGGLISRVGSPCTNCATPFLQPCTDEPHWSANRAAVDGAQRHPHNAAVRPRLRGPRTGRDSLAEIRRRAPTQRPCHVTLRAYMPPEAFSGTIKGTHSTGCPDCKCLYLQRLSLEPPPGLEPGTA